MKKILNLVALICIAGFTGSWECGLCSFKTLLLNSGITLFVVLCFYLTFRFLKILNVKRIKHLKIS